MCTRGRSAHEEKDKSKEETDYGFGLARPHTTTSRCDANRKKKFFEDSSRYLTLERREKTVDSTAISFAGSPQKTLCRSRECST